MLDRLLAAAGESWKIFERNRSCILSQLFFSCLNLAAIGLLVSLIINTNYLLEIFARGDLSWNLLSSILPLIRKLDRLRTANYLLLAALVSLLLYLGYYYHRIYLISYRREARLIFRLKGEKRLVLRPLLLMSFFICSGEVITTWFLVGLIYSYLYSTLFARYFNLSLLGFSHFRISLLIILSLCCAAATLPTVYLLFWRQMKVWKGRQ